MECELCVLNVKVDLPSLESFGGSLRCPCMFLEGLWVNHNSCITGFAVIGYSGGSSPNQRSAFSAQVTSESLVEYLQP